MLTFSERRLQFGELRRLFFGRFLDNDLIAIDGDTRGTLIGILSLLIAPGVFLPFLEWIQFSSAPLTYLPFALRDLAAVPDKTLHIAISMTVIGLLAVFEWDAMLPDRRDIAVLRPMPVGVGTLFAAKISALFQFWVVFTLAVDGIPSFFFPIAVLQNDPFTTLLGYIAAHATALVAANLFVFLAVVAIEGVLIAVLGPRLFHRFAPYAQFVLIAALLSGFFVSVGLAYGLRPGGPPPPLVDALPVFWFLGIDQVAVGAAHMPLFSHLAAHVGPALAAAALCAAAAYAVGYRRIVASSFETHEGATAAPGRLAASLEGLAARRLVTNPSERAAFWFVWQTVMRSRTHRLLVAAWAGAGVALVFQGIAGAIASGHPRWWAMIPGPLLPLPIVLPLFVITGLRYAFTVPSDLKANWIFQMGCGDPAAYLAGARKAALALTVVPLAALLLPVYAAAWGWRLAAVQTIFGTVLALLLVELQMMALEKLPFTCSYVPGKANLKSLWIFYVMGYLIYAAALSWLDLQILRRPWLIVFFLALAAAGAVGIGCFRRSRAADGLSLTFDERPEPAVRTLGLQG
jgi:hypothetical protein